MPCLTKAPGAVQNTCVINLYMRIEVALATNTSVTIQIGKERYIFQRVGPATDRSIAKVFEQKFD